MPERVVFDTGPVIIFARARGLDLLGRLPLESVSPTEVFDELRQGERRGLVLAIPVWLREVRLRGSLDPVALHTLDAGEAAVIQLALENGIRTVVIDEAKGRLAARSVGLVVTGSLGLLGRLRRAGVIEAAKPWVERFEREGARYHPVLAREFLASLGE